MVPTDDSLASSKLAQLYQELKQPHKAAQYYAKFISLHAAEEVSSHNAYEILFLFESAMISAQVRPTVFSCIFC